jgi:hypothetical protein
MAEKEKEMPLTARSVSTFSAQQKDMRSITPTAETKNVLSQQLYL